MKLRAVNRIVLVFLTGIITVFLVIFLKSFSDNSEEYECVEKLNDSTFMKISGVINYGFLDITHERTISLYDAKTQLELCVLDPGWSEHPEFYVAERGFQIEKDTVNVLLFYNFEHWRAVGLRSDNYEVINDSIIRNRISNIESLDSIATSYGYCE